jgi:hypothetical protein
MLMLQISGWPGCHALIPDATGRYSRRFTDRAARSWVSALANVKLPQETIEMSTQAETGNVTGTKDKTYNIIWFTEACLDNALRLETYINDAERDGDDELAELFRKAQADSRKGAEQGKQLLKSRL